MESTITNWAHIYLAIFALIGQILHLVTTVIKNSSDPEFEILDYARKNMWRWIMLYVFSFLGTVLYIAFAHVAHPHDIIVWTLSGFALQSLFSVRTKSIKV